MNRKVYFSRSMRVMFILFYLVLLTMEIKGVNLCLTRNPVIARNPITNGTTLCYIKSSSIADVNVWVGQASFTDLDVCFISEPSHSSIDINIVTNPVIADVTICLTSNAIIADKTLCITNSETIADFCIGIYDKPTSFTKIICVKGIEPEKLTIEEKITILYSLGIIKKK